MTANGFRKAFRGSNPFFQRRMTVERSHRETRFDTCWSQILLTPLVVPPTRTQRRFKKSAGPRLASGRRSNDDFASSLNRDALHLSGVYEEKDQIRLQQLCEIALGRFVVTGGSKVLTFGEHFFYGAGNSLGCVSWTL